MAKSMDIWIIGKNIQKYNNFLIDCIYLIMKYHFGITILFHTPQVLLPLFKWINPEFPQAEDQEFLIMYDS